MGLMEWFVKDQSKNMTELYDLYSKEIKKIILDYYEKKNTLPTIEEVIKKLNMNFSFVISSKMIGLKYTDVEDMVKADLGIAKKKYLM